MPVPEDCGDGPGSGQFLLVGFFVEFVGVYDSDRRAIDREV